MTATISNIKTKFEELIGEDIVIVVEAGRRKTKTHIGVLSETYQSVFVVELEDDGSNDESVDRVSFNYTDVLTNSIEVEFPATDFELQGELETVEK